MTSRHLGNRIKNPSFSFTVHAALSLYNWSWKLWLPFLARHPRLKNDFRQRLGLKAMPPVDLWIQAASAGEAYLAILLLKQLHCKRPIHSLMTTNTQQGLQILQKAADQSENLNLDATVSIAPFPFDRPAIMRAVVNSIRPKGVVFLETEIWPGLLSVLKQNKIPSCIINGRMSSGSFRRYMLWSSFWQTVRPGSVLAVSARDVQRYRFLFGRQGIRAMPNLKFDRIQEGEGCCKFGSNPVRMLLDPKTPFVVMGSVRQAELKDCVQILQHVRQHNPEAIVGIFPRHLEKLPFWEQALQQSSLTWQLRSSCTQFAAPGTVILWDIFGEMNQAFEVAQATFIGGSLAPLGGQNFLEALTHGVTPIIGPFWDDFHWVGRDIMKKGLVIQVQSWQEAAQQILRMLGRPHDRVRIRSKACQYLQAHQGGTRQACRLIEQLLESESPCHQSVK
jgi:3-deoxy-D-manno-octulosonic-acid transferase